MSAPGGLDRLAVPACGNTLPGATPTTVATRRLGGFREPIAENGHESGVTPELADQERPALTPFEPLLQQPGR
jgi:hypothetical protein